MKAIAVAVGVDPVLIERAARLVPAGSRASMLERVLGGPLKYRLDARFHSELGAGRAAHILSLARATFETQGKGEANASGMSWSQGYEVGEASRIFVTAHTEVEGTRVEVAVDRRRVLIPIVLFGGVGAVLSVSFGSAVASAGGSAVVSGVIGTVVAAGGLAGTLAATRAWWRATSRAIQDKVDGLMDAISRSMSEGEDASPLGKGAGGPLR